MNIPIKAAGRFYLNLEIDPKTAYNILCRECVENGKYVRDSFSKDIFDSLITIRDKYSKVFGKNGEEVLLPVKGYFDSEKNSFFITSNEVIKGLFHVFKSYEMNCIYVNNRGIWEDLWNKGSSDGDILLYEGQDAIDVYNAMKNIKLYYDKFVQENNKPVGKTKRYKY